MDRELSDEERAVVEAFLERRFEGSDELREQIRVLRVVGKCPCGCATVEFKVDKAQAPRALVQNPAPVEGTVWNSKRTEVLGGILLFAPDGWLSSLEIYSVDDDPITVFPALNLIDIEVSL